MLFIRGLDSSVWSMGGHIEWIGTDVSCWSLEEQEDWILIASSYVGGISK